VKLLRNRHQGDAQKNKQAKEEDPRPGVVHADQPVFESAFLNYRYLVTGQGINTLFGSISDNLYQIIQGAGLFKIAEHVMLAGKPGRFHAAVAGMHDHLDFRPDFFYFL